MTFDLPILFADEHLLAVNKPAGLPTLPDGCDKSAPCLIHRVHAKRVSRGGSHAAAWPGVGARPAAN